MEDVFWRGEPSWQHILFLALVAVDARDVRTACVDAFCLLHEDRMKQHLLKCLHAGRRYKTINSH